MRFSRESPRFPGEPRSCSWRCFRQLWSSSTTPPHRRHEPLFRDSFPFAGRDREAQAGDNFRSVPDFSSASALRRFAAPTENPSVAAKLQATRFLNCHQVHVSVRTLRSTPEPHMAEQSLRKAKYGMSRTAGSAEPYYDVVLLLKKLHRMERTVEKFRRSAEIAELGAVHSVRRE